MALTSSPTRSGGGRPRRFDPTARARIGGDFGSVPHPAFDGPHPYDGAGPLLPPLLFETDDGELPRKRPRAESRQVVCPPVAADDDDAAEAVDAPMAETRVVAAAAPEAAVLQPAAASAPGWGVLTAAEQSALTLAEQGAKIRSYFELGATMKAPAAIREANRLMGLDNDGPLPEQGSAAAAEDRDP